MTDYPYVEGDFITLGPEIFASEDGSVISWRGENYARQLDPAPSAPADQNLRDRIRRAVCEAEGFGWDTDMLEPDEYGEVADAVLALLPEPRREFDAQAGLQRLADALHRGEESGVSPEPADRAGVLREAAEEVAAHPGPIPYRPQLDQDGGFWWDTRDRDAIVGLLRRMADEAPQAEELPVVEPSFDVIEADPAVRRETVEFFVQSQQPDEAWEQASSTDSRLGFIEERMANLQERFPEAKFRIVQRNTTVVIQALEDCPQCAWGVDHVVHCPHPETHNAGCGCFSDDPPEPTEEAQQPAESEVFGPEVVAYRHPTKPGGLLCRQHGDGRGLTPVEADDLPGGGGCDECGGDVLARQAGVDRG